MVGHRFRDYGSGSDERPSSDRQPRQDHRARTDAAASEEFRALVLWWLMLASRSQVVGEGGVWPNKYVILDLQAFPQVNAALKRYAITNYYALFYKGVVADVAILADLAPGGEMGKGPNLGSSSDFHTWVNQPVRVAKGKVRLLHKSNIPTPQIPVQNS
jgi:hypothetical protein